MIVAKYIADGITSGMLAWETEPHISAIGGIDPGPEPADAVCKTCVYGDGWFEELPGFQHPDEWMLDIAMRYNLATC